jgi:multidrug resistance efflux pump
MEPLTPIPSPPGHLLREFRFRVLPVLVFLLGCVGVVLLWQRQGAGRILAGVGEGNRAFVVSPQPGSISTVLVSPYTKVRKGDPIAVFQPNDPATILNFWRSEMDLARMQATPTLAQQSAVDIERLRMDLLRARSDLAVAKVQLEFAERDVARSERLFKENLVAESMHDLTLSARDMRLAEVKALEEAVFMVESKIAELQAAAAQAPIDTGTVDAVARLQESQARAATNLAPILLVAPMDGVVGPMIRQAGEYLVDGEVVAVIYSEQADRIVGYLRQPFGFHPRAGLAVVVRRRSVDRETFTSRITHVGPQFESITNALGWVRDGAMIDTGLPIVVEVPPDQPLRPGEVVDLLVQSTPAPTSPTEARMTAPTQASIGP